MKRLLTLLAALCVPLVTLTACTVDQALRSAPIIGNVCGAAEGTLIDEKAVYTANALYNVPAHAYVTANRNGQLTPALKAMLKPKLLAMYRLLAAVKAAQGTVNCDYNSMKVLHAEVTALLPKGN